MNDELPPGSATPHPWMVALGQTWFLPGKPLVVNGVPQVTPLPKRYNTREDNA